MPNILLAIRSGDLVDESFAQLRGKGRGRVAAIRHISLHGLEDGHQFLFLFWGQVQLLDDSPATFATDRRSEPAPWVQAR